MKDYFRPRFQPAQDIYDAFQLESKKRDQRTTKEWIELEREAVWKTSCDCAQKLGLRIPLMVEIEEAERSACGHTDYGAKWVYGIVDFMNKKKES